MIEGLPRSFLVSYVLSLPLFASLHLVNVGRRFLLLVHQELLLSFWSD
jgi:hypothetical protein